MESGCILTQKLKSMGASSIFGKLGCRRFRTSTKNVDEEEEEKPFIDLHIYRKFCRVQFGSLDYTNANKRRSSSVDKKKLNIKKLTSRSAHDVSYLHKLKREEIFKASLRRLTGPRSHMLRIQNYLVWKVSEANGVDSYGVYVVDDKNSDNSFCNKPMAKSFRHQSSVVDKLLDTDCIDTENTDFTYIDDFDVDEAALSAGAIKHTLGDESILGDITVNGKVLTVYHTEILSDSNTAPESNQ